MAKGQYQIDPETPAAKQFARVIGEIWAQFIATHTQEEIDAVLAEADRQRELARRIRLQVRPNVRGTDEGGLTPVSEKQET